MNKKEIIQEIYDAINKIPRYQCNSDMGHEFIDTCHIHRLFQKLRAGVEEPATTGECCYICKDFHFNHPNDKCFCPCHRSQAKKGECDCRKKIPEFKHLSHDTWCLAAPKELTDQDLDKAIDQLTEEELTCTCCKIHV